MTTTIGEQPTYYALREFARRTAAYPNGSGNVQSYGYTAKDLDCRYCLYRKGTGTGCKLATCCCAEEKAQLVRRHKKEGVS